MLQELFLEHSAKRPVVVVAGVRVADLRAIMQFIYTGEVSVTEAGLADLLEVADMLGVRGLKAGAGQEAEQGPGREVRGDTEARVELSPASAGASVAEAGSEEQSEEIMPNISITKVASPAPAPAPVPSSPEKKDPSPRPADTFQISVKKDLTDQLLLGGSGDIASTAASPDLAAEDNIAAEDSEEAATSDTDKTASPLFPAAPVPQFSPFSAASFIRPHELGMSPLVSMSSLDRYSICIY